MNKEIKKPGTKKVKKIKSKLIKVKVIKKALLRTMEVVLAGQTIVVDEVYSKILIDNLICQNIN